MEEEEEEEEERNFYIVVCDALLVDSSFCRPRTNSEVLTCHKRREEVG